MKCRFYTYYTHNDWRLLGAGCMLENDEHCSKSITEYQQYCSTPCQSYFLFKF